MLHASIATHTARQKRNHSDLSTLIASERLTDMREKDRHEQLEYGYEFSLCLGCSDARCREKNVSRNVEEVFFVFGSDL